MKLMVQVKLLPSADQEAALAATLRACNAAARHASAVAFETGERSRDKLQRAVYGSLKAEFGLSAQAAVRTVKKVVDAYTSLHASRRAGALGPASDRGRRRSGERPISFRPDAAQPYDDRILSWQHDARTVSIWTVHGRLKGIAFTGHPGQLKTLAEDRKGESDLVYRDGRWFLLATCEVAEAERIEPNDWLGVDRGIVNLATTSDGDNHQGRRLARYRRHQARKRAELQAKQTRSAKRRAKRRAKKESRHATHLNHKISKEIVAVAQRTGRGIAVEDLGGIRERVRPSRDQRAAFSCWPFHQLGEFLAYKARRVGVAFLTVDPAFTSQTCPVPWCGHVSRRNRPTRGHFQCRQCGLAGPADVVAGINVRNRARSAWVFVNTPALSAVP